MAILRFTAVCRGPASWLFAALGLTACYSQPGDEVDDGTSAGTAMDGSGGGPTGSTTPPPTTGDTATTATGTSATTPPATTDVDTTVGDSATGTTGPESPFVTDDTDPMLYTRVDRAGLPFINTALLRCINPGGGNCMKDDYNNATRADDDSGIFVGEFLASMNPQLQGVAADLSGPGLGLSTCASANDCFIQAVSLLFPDTLKLDPSVNNGFPNGRAPADAAIDITFAVLWLDLGVHPNTALANLPLNPPSNDVPLPATFPFVAPPHR